MYRHISGAVDRLARLVGLDSSQRIDEGHHRYGATAFFGGLETVGNDRVRHQRAHTVVDSDHTVVKAYAWDLENNVSDEKTFTVQHVRTTKRGSYKLTDERDIYEMVANKAARRKRSCLLAVMPGWYVEAALDACNETLRNSVTNGKTIEEVREAVVTAFAEFGVSPDNIAAKLSRPIDKLDPNDIVKLRHLYAAIKDGFVKAQDAFDLAATTPEDLPSEEEENALEALNRELTGGRNAADS